MAKAGAFAAAVIAAVLAVVLLGPRLLVRLGGAENELLVALKSLEREGFSIPLREGTLRSERLHYQRMSVSVDEAAGRGVVRCTLDFTGTFGAGTRVSSLGYELVPFEWRSGAWEPSEGPAPRLAAIVAALERRRRQEERGPAGLADPGEPRADAVGSVDRRYRAEAWYVRSERELVEVAEDYRLSESRPDRPVDERGTRRLAGRAPSELDGGGFFMFAPALE